MHSQRAQAGCEQTLGRIQVQCVHTYIHTTHVVTGTHGCGRTHSSCSPGLRDGPWVEEGGWGSWAATESRLFSLLAFGLCTWQAVMFAALKHGVGAPIMGTDREEEKAVHAKRPLRGVSTVKARAWKVGWFVDVCIWEGLQEG